MNLSIPQQAFEDDEGNLCWLYPTMIKDKVALVIDFKISKYDLLIQSKNSFEVFSKPFPIEVNIPDKFYVSMNTKDSLKENIQEFIENSYLCTTLYKNDHKQEMKLERDYVKGKEALKISMCIEWRMTAGDGKNKERYSLAKLLDKETDSRIRIKDDIKLSPKKAQEFLQLIESMWHAINLDMEMNNNSSTHKNKNKI